MKLKRIVHKDLKLENILLTNKSTERFEIKIADFGLSEHWTTFPEPMKSRCGTPGSNQHIIF